MLIIRVAVFLLAPMLETVAVPAQAPQQAKPSPVQVVERYVALKESGALLTPEGWKKAGTLFVRPSLAPQDTTIWVVSKSSSVSEYRRGTNQAEVHEWGIDQLGKIDGSLGYTPPPKRTDWQMHVYRLVLTNKYWEPGEQGQPAREVTGSLEWRIEGDQGLRWATIDAAIPYVIMMRDKTSDPAIKKNADNTLARLRSIAAQDRR